MDMPLLTILTPTYNRGHLLGNCYRSLLAQTDMDFEWIVVDDGSMDNTPEVVSGFQTEKFPIFYIKKENGGKHTALNASHPYVRGRYVLILDSDDTLVSDAVRQVRQGWKKWEEDSRIGIVTFLKGSAVDVPNCTGPIAGEPVDLLRYKRNIIHSGDCCEVLRAELFLKYPFPAVPGEGFVAECALWNRIAMTHQCVYVNEVIYLCEYLQGGLTDAGRPMRLRNPRGGMVTSDLRMGKNNYFMQRIKYGLLYCCYGFFAGMNAGMILSGTEHKAVAVMCLLPGYGLYRFWKKRYME